MRRIFALLLIAASFSVAHADNWHALTKLTKTERESTSYKFLVSKFGARNLLVICDPEEAADAGPEYLIQVMGSGLGERVGETIGHGETLQSALDAAAASYISPETVRKLHEEWQQRAKERALAVAKYKKMCCGAQK